MKTAKSTPKVRSTPPGPKPAPPPKAANGPKSTRAKAGDKAAKGPAAGKPASKTSSTSSKNSAHNDLPQPKEAKVRAELLRGRFDVDCPPNVKLVRIFTSSTFTDSSHERNALMARVYPKLKSFCQEAGYEFQIVDMRWGIRDEAADNHMTTELCLQEVRQCQRLSTGPNFVTFLSHKYGYRAFPSRIEAKEFEKILSKVESEEDKAMVNKWFKKDDNSVPPRYVLLPISTHLPDFVSEDSDKRDAAKQTWNKESSGMKETLVRIAEKVLSPAEHNKYIISVTEAEIQAGILSSDDINNHCVWFRRVIPQIEDQEKTDLLAKYIDFSASESEQRQKRALIKELVDKKLPSVLGQQQIHQHTIDWTDNGIDPDGNDDHQRYLDSLCEDFEKTITAMIRAGIEERNTHALTDDLYDELLQHTLFTQIKCRSFHGRQQMLERIKEYILGKSRAPLVVHGQSGSGKTSVMAKAAMLARSWVDGQGKGIVLLRYLGTTPDSTGISSVLTSVTKQLLSIANQPMVVPTEMKDIVELFSKTVSRLSSPEVSVVIFLDSLDQLDPSHGARQLSWLPKHLPPHVKIVVSTLPEPTYECFPRLQVMIKDPNQFLEVPTLPEKDVSSILDSWLSLESRTLTSDQKSTVLDAFKQYPIPLFLKLSFDEACRWKSFERPEDTVLETTVKAAINGLFDRVERLHGKLLVSRALTLLTLSVSGLTESELEDILSCDEEVLNDVYQYWLPPVRRLPPLLLVRMKADLGEYLVDRGADGVRVFYWYHRQFIETAAARYCSDQELNKKVHTLLADFFRGTWNGVAKSYTDSKGGDGEADRFVAAQPLKFGATPNLRKLANLPYHLIRADMRSVLKQDVCLNMEFLLAKLKASSLRAVLDDFEDASKTFPDDEDITLVLEALRLSQDALLYDPNELPCQLLGRLPAEKEHVFGDLSNFPTQYLLPNTKVLTPPGGQLTHCLAGHKEAVNCVDLSSDGSIAVTASTDRSVRFWNAKQGKIIQAIENVVEDPQRIQICNNDKMVVVDSEKNIVAFRIPTGDRAYTIGELESDDSNKNFVVCGKEKNTLVILGDKVVYIMDASTGKRRCQLVNSSPMGNDSFSPYDPISGVGRFVATATSNSAILRVIDVVKAEFIHNKRVFPAPKTDDDDELTIDALAIAPDKKTVLFSNYMDNDVHICHLKTMAKLRVLKGKKSDSSEKFHISLDGSTLYYPNNVMMCYVDLKTGDRVNHIKHPNSIADIATRDMIHVVSVSGDSVVRIWDLSREDPQAKPKPVEQQQHGRPKSGKKRQGKEAAVSEGQVVSDTDAEKEQKFRISMIQTLPNPRYAFVTNRGREVQVYDIARELTVRSAKISSETSVKWVPIDEKTAIAKTDGNRLQLVDLDKMEPIRVIQGYLPKYNSDTVVRKKAKEIVTPTRGRKQLKIHNIDSGLTVHIISTGQEKLIEDLLISPDGSWLAASTDEGPVLVVNLDERVCRHTLGKDVVGEYPYLSDSLFTPCNTFLLMNCNRKYPFAPDIEESYFLVINTDTGKIVQHLLDVEYYQKYKDSSVDFTVDVGCHAYLRDFLLLVGSDDRLIRVWDIQSGKLLHRLTGHSHDVSTLVSAEDGCRFLSYSSYTEEEAFRLWDGLTFTCLATFKADDDMIQICLSLDGSRILAGNPAKKNVVVWRLTGEGTQSEEVKGQSEFEEPQTSLTFTPIQGPVTFDEADPDVEAEEVSDDDSESDDDDKNLDGLDDLEDDLELDLELSDLNLSDSDEEIAKSKADGISPKLKK